MECLLIFPNMKTPSLHIQPQHKVDFKVLNEPLQKTYTEILARAKKLSGSSMPLGAPVIIRLHLEISYSAYQATRYLYAEMPEDPKRKPEFLTVGPPIQRSMLDGLFNIVYLGLDLEKATHEYYRGVWKETLQYYRRYKKKYGQKPDWQDCLEGLEKLVAELARSEKLNEADYGTVNRWPTPGDMCRRTLPKGTKDFFLHLQEWFYRSYSQEDHLSWPGLARRGVIFLRDLKSEPDQEYVKKQKSDQLYRALLILLMTLSEVNAQFSFGFHTQLQYIWTILLNYFDETRELYDLRYRALLSVAT